MGGLGGQVAIIGTGTIKFGENFHQSLSDMIVEAVNLPIPVTRVAAYCAELGVRLVVPLAVGGSGGEGEA